MNNIVNAIIKDSFYTCPLCNSQYFSPIGKNKDLKRCFICGQVVKINLEIKK